MTDLGGGLIFQLGVVSHPTMVEPDEEAVEEPTTEPEQEKEAATWMAMEGTSIAAISILATLLAALAMMQYTGLIDLGQPIANTQIQQWMVWVVLFAFAFGAFAWGQKRT